MFILFTIYCLPYFTLLKSYQSILVSTVFRLLVIVTLELFLPKVKEWNENGVARWKSFRRQKREWIKFAANCREGEDNSRKNPIAKIRSDCEENLPIIYSISGIGIDQPPYGIFVINSKTGEINITSIVDREVTSEFVIRCFAKHALTHRDLEPPLDLRVRVLDINDNAPIFSQATYMGSIEECSMENTLVMKIVATDADEPNNLNSKIAYKIESQEPAGASMFILNKHTGEVHIANFLDREQHSSYSLVVKASDRDGAADGISSLCSCTIQVIDVNDNFPVLSQSSYSATIVENSLSSELLRIQVLDADEQYSDNWLAEFFFISGNEDNCFEFVTDPATNEGILRVIKPLNYEYLQSYPLSFGVRNKAAFHHSVATQYQISGTPLMINVKNVVEPPYFSPSSMSFFLPRSLSTAAMLNYIVGAYTATDEETRKIASNVRYRIGHDPAAWFRVSPTTGEIFLNKIIDRESSYVVNGLYRAKLLAITRDVPAKTSTGTIVLVVDDSNYYCPTLSTEMRKVCMSSPRVIITAKDLDGDTYSPPFTFIIANQPARSYSAELSTQNIEFFIYDVYVHMIDNQGRRCQRPQRILLQACLCDSRLICTNGATKRNVTNDIPDVTIVHDLGGITTLGGAAIALMFLGGLIFVLFPILMAMSDCCGYGARPVGGVGAGFEPVPECTEGAIHSWGIEGAHPEDMVSPYNQTGNIYTNTYGGGAVVTSGLEETTGLGTAVGYGTTNSYGAATAYGTMGKKESIGGTLREYREGGVNMAFLDSYFSEKAFAYADEDEGRPANDCLLIYDHEGIGTPVGSIGCCSFIGEDIDDTYLDTLGPKFKTLAEICLGKVIEPMPGVNATFPNIESDLKLPPPGTTIIVNESSSMPPPVGSTTIPARPIPDPLLHGNVMVTETYTSGSTFQPPTLSVDPLRASNVVVTERVLAPASDLRGILDIPDLTDGANVVVTERVIAPGSRLPPSLSIPDLADASNVVVTERVIRPASGLGMGGMSSMTGQMLSADTHLSQTVGSVSPGTSRRRVTKYSTIQYANQ
uniref:Desmoglein 1 n=1 Tax=Chrysemys picta bellii TaxID=8478 RepID=A0A8C3I7L3_CHRPI